MDYYQKYLKYRTKYLNLKNKNLGLIGGAKVVVNLDQYKDLFKRCINEIPLEIGFNLLYDKDTQNTSFEVIKGNKEFVTIPFKNVINIHTHHIELSMYKNFQYQPPTQYDYNAASIDFFNGNQINIVVEKAGIWLFKPNEGLIKEIEKIQPNAKEIFSTELADGESIQRIDGVSDRFFVLRDVIFTNTANEGLYLNFTGDNIKHVLSGSFINSYIENRVKQTGDNRKESIQIYGREAESILPMLSLEQLKLISSHYHKIELDEYINNINNVVTEGMGFEIKFIKWDEPFNIEIEINEKSEKIFNDIKSRNLMIDDFDTIKANLDKTNEFYIIRQ
jgi:hypothetical protein